LRRRERKEPRRVKKKKRKQDVRIIEGVGLIESRFLLLKLSSRFGAIIDDLFVMIVLSMNTQTASHCQLFSLEQGSKPLVSVK
jgi:hypothetical protein